jgi:hypothetical protein
MTNAIDPDGEDRGAARKKARARQARYRATLAAGGAVLRVAVKDFNAVIAILMDLRWLAEQEAENREQIGIAIGLLVDDLAAFSVTRRGPPIPGTPVGIPGNDIPITSDGCSLSSF